MANSRVSRGRRIQGQAAEYFKEGGWAGAQSTPASLPGKDVTGMPGWSVEVKGSRDNPLPAALRQAAGNAEEGETPLVVWCPDGYGEKRIDEWVVSFRFKDAVELMRKVEGFPCVHDNTWFSRTACACGVMHYYCADCGEQQDECDVESEPTQFDLTVVQDILSGILRRLEKLEGDVKWSSNMQHDTTVGRSGA